MTSAIDEALATVPGISSLLLSGKSLTEDIGAALTDTTILRTIAGAPTLTLQVEDPHRTILKSNLFASRVTAHISPFTFEVAQLNKNGPALTVTCEDQVVAELRRHKTPMSVGAGRLTHVQFAKRMVHETKWIKFITDTHAHVVKSKEPLTRGDPTSKDPSIKYESTWDALNRIADARGWRVFVRGNDELWYVPDSYLLGAKDYFRISEDDDAVDNIDFDYDIGKPAAKLNVTVRSARWTMPPGSLCTVDDLPPVNGKWVLQDISKKLTSTTSQLLLVRAQPILPEPEQAKVVAGGMPALKATTMPTGSLVSLIAPPPNQRKAMPGNQQPTLTLTAGGVAPPRTKSRLAADFVIEAMSQAGKAYVWGASPSAASNNPGSFDCSALVQWAAARVGIALPRTSGSQYALCAQHHTLITPAAAKHIKGAILFLGHAGSEHVVISLGNGQDTIEARGKAYGVGYFSINRDNWSGAAYIPGMWY